LQYDSMLITERTADIMQSHPVTALPAFFIHPCNTAKALEEICQNKACSPEEYLVTWLGLVGPSVNLYIPSQLLPVNSRDEQ
jgi:ubiquitin-like-conjugating enzyme ATG10